MKNSPKSQAIDDLEHLLGCIESAPELERYFKTRATNIAAQITTYETLWTVFAPRTRIIAKPFLNTPQILEVMISPIPFQNPAESSLRMWVRCWDWNGKKMVRVFYPLIFERFRGTRPINELEYYPVDFDPDKEALLARINDRSVRFINAIRVKPGSSQMFTYHGDIYGDRRKTIASADDNEVSLGSRVHKPTNADRIDRKMKVAGEELHTKRGHWATTIRSPP